MLPCFATPCPVDTVYCISELANALEGNDSPASKGKAPSPPRSPWEARLCDIARGLDWHSVATWKEIQAKHINILEFALGDAS